MKNLKTRIFAATLLSAIALAQPAQLQAINLKLGLGLVAGVTVTGIAATYAFMDSAYTQQMKQYKAALDNIKTTASQEQITVKKGQIFTIERKASTEIGQKWSLHNWSDDIVLIGLAGAAEHPGEKSVYFHFKAKEVGAHTITFRSTHKPVEVPLKSCNARMSFIDHVTVTVTVQDDAAEDTTSPSNIASV